MTNKTFKRFLSTEKSKQELKDLNRLYESVRNDISEFTTIIEAFISPGEIVNIFNIASKKRGSGKGFLGSFTSDNRSASNAANQVKQRIEPVIDQIYDQAEQTEISHEVQSDDKETAEEAQRKLNKQAIKDKVDIKTALSGQRRAADVNKMVDYLMRQLSNSAAAAFISSTLSAAAESAKKGTVANEIFAMLSFALDKVNKELDDTSSTNESIINEGPLDFLSRAWSRVTDTIGNSNVGQNASNKLDILKGQLGLNGGRGEVDADILKRVWKNKYHGSTDSADIEQILKDFKFSDREIKNIFKEAGITKEEDYNEELVRVASLIKKAGLRAPVLSWLKRNQSRLYKLLPESIESPIMEKSTLSDKDVLDIITQLTSETEHRDTNELDPDNESKQLNRKHR
ncbi:hypothetical protein [Pseudomonas phage vB_Pa-PAC2]